MSPPVGCQSLHPPSPDDDDNNGHYPSVYSELNLHTYAELNERYVAAEDARRAVGRVMTRGNDICQDGCDELRNEVRLKADGTGRGDRGGKTTIGKQKRHAGEGYVRKPCMTGTRKRWRARKKSLFTTKRV